MCVCADMLMCECADISVPVVAIQFGACMLGAASLHAVQECDATGASKNYQ